MTQAFSLILQNEYFPQSMRKDLDHLTWPIVMKDLKYEQVKEVQQVLYSYYVHPSSLSILYQFLYSDCVNVKHKFVGLQRMRDNIFTSKEEKEEGLTLFCNAQKVYYMFSKLANIFRQKKLPARNTENMLMEPVELSMKNVFCVVENGGKYLFSLTDLVNIFKMALLNLEFFIISPNSVKNPYTNNCFNKSTLLNMYFFIRFRVTCVPAYIEKFFRCNLNIRLFLRLHKSWLQDLALDNYVKTTHYTQLKSGITAMLYDYNLENQRSALRVHSGFPEKELCEIMRPYLTLYYKSRYSTDNTLLWHYKFLFKERMKKFYKFNSRFGSLMTRRVANLKYTRSKEARKKRQEDDPQTYRYESYHNKGYLSYKDNNHYENLDLYLVSHVSNNDFSNAPDDVNEFSRETIGTDAQDTDEYNYDEEEDEEMFRMLGSSSNQTFREMAQQYNLQRNPSYRGGNTAGNSALSNQQGSRVTNNVLRRLTRRRDDDEAEQTTPQTQIYQSTSNTTSFTPSHPRLDPIHTPQTRAWEDRDSEEESDGEIHDPTPDIIFGPREANANNESQNSNNNLAAGGEESDSTPMSIETDITEDTEPNSSEDTLTPLTSPDENTDGTDMHRALSTSDFNIFED